MRVAEREPAETRQEPAAPPLDEQPRAWNGDEPAQRSARRQKFRDQPPEQRVVGAHDRDEADHEEQREQERRVTDLLDGDVQPVRAHEERAGVEPEPEHRGATWLCAVPEPHEERRRQNGERPPANRRKGQRQQHARDERGRTAGVPAFDEFAGTHSSSSGRSSGGTMSRGAVSRRESIRRRSKRMTLSSQSASCSVSPRRGNRPSCFMTRPATVSNSSSESSVWKYSLNSSMGVWPRTTY